MKVKGSAVAALQQFIKESQSVTGYASWLEALPAASRGIFSGGVLQSDWFPLSDGFIVPTQTMCDLFHAGNQRAAWEVGAFSARSSLRGIYRTFVRVASVAFVVDRAGSIFSTYYMPGRISTVERDTNRFVLHMTGVDEPHRILEYRICGWIEGALELCNAKQNRISISKSAAAGAPLTEIIIEV
jgi:hypothetical protein